LGDWIIMKLREIVTETRGALDEIKKGQKDANGFTRCWPGKHAEGTKKGKNGGQVRKCVPNEGVAEATRKPRKPAAPQFTKYTNYDLWERERYARGANYTETEIDGRLVGVAVVGTTYNEWGYVKDTGKVVGMWYNKAGIGSFVQDGTSFDESLSYAEQDTTWPYMNESQGVAEAKDHTELLALADRHEKTGKWEWSQGNYEGAKQHYAKANELRDRAKKAQGVTESTGGKLPGFLSYVLANSQGQFSDIEEIEDLFDYAYLSDLDLETIADGANEDGVTATKWATPRMAWLLKNISDKSKLAVIKPLAASWLKTVAPAIDQYVKDVLSEQGVAEAGNAQQAAIAIDMKKHHQKPKNESRDMCHVCGQTPCNCTHLTEGMTLDQQFDMIEEMVEHLAEEHGVDADAIWEDFDTVSDEELLAETAAWKRKAGKNKNGGLNKKGVASYRREHPGSKLQTAVTTKPSKLKKGSKAANRRKSFCARMGGMKGPMTVSYTHLRAHETG
jgi:hypothetical protein